MSKVWIVTVQNSYDDYRIIGVHSSKAAATAWLRDNARNGDYGFDIEEWDVDGG